MFERVRNVLEAIRTSLWVLPVLMTAVAMALAQGMILVDQSGWLDRHPGFGTLSEHLGMKWLFGTGVESARSLLATIGGSMVAIAATVFSITVVVLSLAAGQMGPRLLRTFMRDRGTQASLGMFIATFAYCIIVLGIVDASGATPFVPKASVSVALVLALTSLAVLIYFVHHVAKSIQAPEVISVVGKELEEAVDRLFPEQLGDDPAAEAKGAAPRLPDSFGQTSLPIRSRASGYLQLIDGEALVKLAAAADIIVWLRRRPGDHVIAGTEIARVWPGTKCTDDLGQRVRGAMELGRVRTPVQDVLFPVNQLVEIAQRALSPGINDPITAEACIDYLGSALGKLAQRGTPSGFRVDQEGKLRLVARRDTFESILGAAFDPIRNDARTSFRVSLRMGDVIVELAQLTRTPEQRQALVDQAQMIQRGAQDLREERDRVAVEDRCRQAIAALSGATGDRPAA